MFFHRHPFVRDGLLSIGVTFGWSAANSFLCKPRESIICDFFVWMLNSLWKPALAIINGLIEPILKYWGLNSSQAQAKGTDEIVALSIGIPFFLLYWFLLGGTICFLWRSARGQILAAFGKTGPQS